MGNFLLYAGGFCYREYAIIKKLSFFGLPTYLPVILTLQIWNFWRTPQRYSGSAGAKKILDVLESDTKADFQENIPGKV